MIELLGHGGMGEVWEAVNQRNHNRKVALKLLSPEALSDPERAERFRRECELAARINHQHILPVYDYAVDGRPYIAMQLVEGRTDLASEIKSGPLPPERAVAIVEQVAAALDAAHQKNLRHRDVKPSNVLLVPGARAGSDHVWLFDWGIAQLLDTAGAPAVTRVGCLVGTPAYIAPERLQANVKSDHRADIYSLAVVLYECLTGKPPFDGDGMAVLTAHLTRDPPSLPPELPKALQ